MKRNRNRYVNYVRRDQAPKRFINKMGIKLATLALALGIGTFSLLHKGDDTLVLGVTKDIAEDTYNNAIPLFSDPDGKIFLTTIAKNKIIITMDDMKDFSGPEHMHLVSTLDDDDRMVTGYTNEKYLGKCTEITKDDSVSLYKVSSEGGTKLREKPEISDAHSLSIPENSVLIGLNTSDYRKGWADVIYFNGSNIERGYAPSGSLQVISNIDDSVKPSKEKAINIYSPVNNEFGIDVSNIDPIVLDKLLKGEIKLSESVESVDGKRTNLSRYDKKIKFVYIKAIGTAPFAKELKKGKDMPYKELAEVCAKNKVPFGFYCYSTCTNEKEAQLEYKMFSETIKAVKGNPYHLLPLAIDIEPTNNKDRQYNTSIDELTNAKVELTNMLEKDFGKTILYIPRNAYNKDLKSRILDLEQYQEGLESGNSHVWHVTPINSRRHAESLSTIAEHVTAKQIALDVKINKNRNNLVDINLIDKKAFSHYLSR